MTLTLHLAPETERKLSQRAAQVGVSAEGLAQRFIEEALGVNGATGPAGKTFAEIFAPVRQEFRQSGLTEEELGRLIEEAREESWREGKVRQGS